MAVPAKVEQTKESNRLPGNYCPEARRESKDGAVDTGLGLNS